MWSHTPWLFMNTIWCEAGLIATPNKFPVSCSSPTFLSWKSVWPNYSFNDVTDPENGGLHLLCDHLFRANGRHIVERHDLWPLMLQNAPAMDHLWARWQEDVSPWILSSYCHFQVCSSGRFIRSRAEEAQVGRTKDTLDPISNFGKRLCHIDLGVYMF